MAGLEALRVRAEKETLRLADLFDISAQRQDLYVADIGGQKTYRYEIQRDGSLSGKNLFCEMGSDGMTIDSEGNVHLTGEGVIVFDPSGRRIEQIVVDAPWTANVCFGGKDHRTLFITASQSVFGLRMRVNGVGSQ